MAVKIGNQKTEIIKRLDNPYKQHSSLSQNNKILSKHV